MKTDGIEYLVMAGGCTVMRMFPNSHLQGGEGNLYHDLCWQCHGPKGQGDGPLSSVLKNDARHRWWIKKKKKPHRYYTKGKGAMPA